jgi:photosystem II stability/assembly factor-like uncharacterized protein
MKKQLSIFALLFLVVSCNLTGTEDEQEDLTVEITGIYEALFSGDTFVGSSSLRIEKLTHEEVRIIPHSSASYPSFSAKVERLANGNFGFKIANQEVSGGSIVGGEFPSLPGYNGGVIVSDNQVVYKIIFTKNGVDEEVQTVSTEKVDDIDEDGTCENGIQDGDETGIDCGGTCSQCEESPTSFIDTLKTASSGSMFWAIGFYNNQIGLAYSRNAVENTLFKTSDGGENWTPFNSPTTSIVREIHFLNETNVLLVADDGVYRSDTGGLTWSPDTTLAYSYSIYIIDEQHAVAASGSYILSYSEDGGVTWAESAIDETFNAGAERSFHFVEEGIGYVTFRNGSDAKVYVYKTNDYGKSWTYVSQPLTGSVTVTHFQDENIGFMGGEFEGIIKTIDGGATWSIVEGVESSNNVIYFRDGIGIVGGSYLFTTKDNGLTWEEPSELNPLSAQAFSAIDNVIFIATQQHILKISLNDIK